MTAAVTALFVFCLIMYFSLEKMNKRVKAVEASLDELGSSAVGAGSDRHAG